MKQLAKAMLGVRGRFLLGGLLMFALAAAMPGVSGLSAQAQDAGQGKYLTEAAARLGKLIGKANKEGYEFVDNNFSVGGGWLKQGTDNWVPLYTLNLEAGKKYRFLAAGDFDAKDVDLEIKDAKGKTVASDEATASEAIVDFTPKQTGKYLVRVRLFASDQNLPCMCLAVVLREK